MLSNRSTNTTKSTEIGINKNDGKSEMIETNPNDMTSQSMDDVSAMLNNLKIESNSGAVKSNSSPSQNAKRYNFFNFGGNQNNVFNRNYGNPTFNSRNSSIGNNSDHGKNLNTIGQEKSPSKNTIIINGNEEIRNIRGIPDHVLYNMNIPDSIKKERLGDKDKWLFIRLTHSIFL